MEKRTVDSGKLLASYLKNFPSFTRVAGTLKDCWINYKKTPAYRRFIDSLDVYL